MRVAAIQVSTQIDKAANIEAALTLVDLAAGAGVDLAVLPEYVDYMGPAAGIRPEPIPGPSSEAFAAKAREHGIWLLAGSIRESAPDGRCFNTSVLYDRGGEPRASYRKVHLYDVEIPGKLAWRESASVAPGDRIVTADMEGVGVGLSVCYDLRFPELYREQAVRGAQVLLVPAAFMLYTGRDHWEVLLRARAIENQAYVVAAAQVGSHEGGICYGRSMVVDPWGTVVACAPDEIAMITAEIDLDRVARIRSELPSLANRRPEVYGGAAEAVAAGITRADLAGQATRDPDRSGSLER